MPFYSSAMHLDVIDLRAFYSSPLGDAARRAIGLKTRQIWSNLTGQSLLGLGYATPYLLPFQDEASRTLAMMPASQGVMRWPGEGPSLTALVDETRLPLNDASIDRILLVHSLETSEQIRPALRELWRVLAPGGKLLIIAPNRIGPWARLETTPFGHGRPFSRSQLTHLLRDCLFSPEQWSASLYMPPLGRMMMLRNPDGWERVGKLLWPRFAGVWIVEASKQIYVPIPEQSTARIRQLITAQLQPRA
ncbi:MAG: methyltransferase domain-containing protein [Alphaproteobacteria bacterium]